MNTQVSGTQTPVVKTKVTHIFSLLERIEKLSAGSTDQARLIRGKLLAIDGDKGSDRQQPSEGILNRITDSLIFIKDKLEEDIDYKREILEQISE